MNLWVRSQNRNVLMKVETIGINQDNETEIVGYGVDVKGILIIGKYKSKERALEVINDIQCFLFKEISISGDYEHCDLEIKNYISTRMGKCYTMPEE